MSNETNESGVSQSLASSGQRVFIMIKRDRDDPFVPRVEVLDRKSKDDPEVWDAGTTVIEPRVVNPDKDVILSMRVYVDLLKNWSTLEYNKNMPITEYCVSVSAGRETRYTYTLSDEEK